MAVIEVFQGCKGSIHRNYQVKNFNTKFLCFFFKFNNQFKNIFKTFKLSFIICQAIKFFHKFPSITKVS